MFEIEIFGQSALTKEEDRHRTNEHRADAEADGDDEQVVRKCECTNHAVEREAGVEDFQIKEGAKAGLCHLACRCDGASRTWFTISTPMKVRSPAMARSEEHTSELQSLMRISYAGFCLKKNTEHTNTKYKI